MKMRGKDGRTGKETGDKEKNATTTLSLPLTFVYCTCLTLACDTRVLALRDKNEQGFCMCVIDALSFFVMTQPPDLFSLFAVSFRSL